ncbi:MAG TPA: DUF5985 family protein [Terracidiphilus sp.]|nr:DUF5985 family protein [Terracidiphilus sp.]
MRPATYILCTLVSLICAVLLLRGYIRGRHKLLLWSGLCFSGLTAANVVMFFDLVLLPNVSLYLVRETITAFSMLILLFGMIWEAE